MHGHKMFCMMNSGKPLSKTIADVLLYNAYDMFHENRRVQRIKSRKYDGIIESNLSVVEQFGFPCVKFEADISTENFESNKVVFVIRVDDLDGLEQGEWEKLSIRVFGPFDFDDLPEEIKRQIENTDEEEEKE